MIRCRGSFRNGLIGRKVGTCLEQYESEILSKASQCGWDVDGEEDDGSNIKSRETMNTQATIGQPCETWMDLTTRCPHLLHEDIAALDHKYAEKNQHSDRNDDWTWFPHIRSQSENHTVLAQSQVNVPTLSPIPSNNILRTGELIHTDPGAQT